MLSKLLSKPYLALLYSAFILFLCVIPSEELKDMETDDKTAHFLAFTGISFLWMFVDRHWLKVLIGGILFGIAIEFIQAALPESFHRSFDWYDALADGIGVCIGLFIYYPINLIMKKLEI